MVSMQRFPLGLVALQSGDYGTKPSCRGGKVSKERTGIVTACTGGWVVLRMERSRSLGWVFISELELALRCLSMR